VSYPWLNLFADNFITPTQSNWAVTALSLLNLDGSQASIKERQFDDTTEQGIGFLLNVPSGATNITFNVKGRPDANGGGGCVWKLYYREIPNGAAVGSWNSRGLGTMTVAATFNYQTSVFTFTLASFSPALNGGSLYQMELTRDASNGSDTLSGTFELVSLLVGFS
jgi:hypothetical protein